MIEVRLGGAREAFEGPLDLLLALVRRGGYPLDQLPVAQITREFLSCLDGLRAEPDAPLAEALAEFTDAASWLVLLKSRALLPPTTGSEPGEGPEQELGRALLGQAALQDAARLLRARMEEAGLPSGARPDAIPGAAAASADPTLPTAGVPSAGAPPSGGPTIADAVQSARRALDALRARPPADPYPLEAELARVGALLAALAPGKAVFAAPWFAARPTPEARAALLLALLELARTGCILLHQPEDFGPLALKRVG